ncbi:MAG: AAA family ATPase [Isosphaeraceae bacterium]
MPSKLVLDSLEVHNFRGLRDLRIKNLGRANLIVGKNNVGKTTVLEALRLYSQPASADVLLELLESRDELGADSARMGSSRDFKPVPIENLFYGRNPTDNEADSIRIGPVDSPDKTLSVRVKWPRKTTPFQEEEYADPAHVILSFQQGTIRLALLVANVSELRQFRQLSGLGIRLLELHKIDSITIKSFFVSANSLDPFQIGRLWDSIALTKLEDDVIALMRIIAPDVERLSLVVWDESSTVRIPVLKTKEFDQPIPLRSMGGGVNRLFGVALALVNAKDGILLVDEIENGIHYTAQLDLWRFIFQAAARLNVQVFATTHSYDCIKAFQQASDESPEDGVLIRLARKNDQILVGEFNEDELEVVVEEQIEVR